MDQSRCSYCGQPTLEPGFLEDSGQAAQGYLRWIPGPLERGPLGAAKRLGKARLAVDVWRCTSCFHLELFAGRT